MKSFCYTAKVTKHIYGQNEWQKKGRWSHPHNFTVLHNFVQQVLSKQLLPGLWETRRTQLWELPAANYSTGTCTYCAWSCEPGGTPITWCRLTSRCPQFKWLVMPVLEMLPTYLTKVENFAGPTWFRDRLIREVKKCLLSNEALFHAPSCRRWNITMF